jgi:hypothetical protein
LVSRWAIISWFVPFVNYVVPKRVMNVIWRASDDRFRLTAIHSRLRQLADKLQGVDPHRRRHLIFRKRRLRPIGIGVAVERGLGEAGWLGFGGSE